MQEDLNHAIARTDELRRVAHQAKDLHRDIAGQAEAADLMSVGLQQLQHESGDALEREELALIEVLQNATESKDLTHSARALRRSLREAIEKTNRPSPMRMKKDLIQRDERSQ